MKGQLQQIEGKAKFTRDETLTQSEEYVALKESYEKMPEEVRSKVNRIQTSASFRRSREEAEDVDVNDEDGRRQARRGRDVGTGGRGQRQDGNERGERRGRRSLERKEDGEEKPAKKSNKPR